MADGPINIAGTKPGQLNELVRLLSEAYHPDKIYLFGSRARGDERPDSDFDLLLVVPDDASPDRLTSRMAYERLWGMGADADVLVWTRNRFNACVHLPATFPATVLREGRVLYGA